MKIKLYQIDAFTSKLFGGNPAGVCTLDAWPKDDLMQAIAKENNLAETAFFVPEGKNYSLRWFTPKVEVDLCGHATLAASFVIFNCLGYKHNEIIFSSRSGILKTSRKDDFITLDFPAIGQEKIDIPAKLTEALGKEPLETYMSGDYMAVFRSEEDILSLKPDFGKLLYFGCRGVITTARGKNCDFVSRFFAPAVGIDEDPVTGSAHCQLVPYWTEKLAKEEFHAMQLSERGGELICKNLGDRILISGRAVKYMEGTIEIFQTDGL